MSMKGLRGLYSPWPILYLPSFRHPCPHKIESGMTARSPYDTLVTVYGGSGFLGRHVVRALAKRHYRIRVAVRRPELAGYLQPLGRVGQIHAVQANLRHAPSVEAAARDAQVVVNLVGILFERGRQRFDSVHAYGAEQVALAANAHGARMIQVSAIGADENSASAYARSKAKAEQLVLAAQPSAVIMRPSIMFGPEDDFFNRFASLARLSPGAAADRRRPDAIPAGLCRRRCNRNCGCRGRQRAAGRHLRTGRAGGADVQGAHAIRTGDDRAQAAADANSILRRQNAGDVFAVPADSRC